MQDKRTITVEYNDIAKSSFWSGGVSFNGGSTSYVPSQGNEPKAAIDPTRTKGAVWDRDALDAHIPQANTAEEFAHEVLGHIWGELEGGDRAGTTRNMRDSVNAENGVRAVDKSRGEKPSPHNINEMPE